MACVGVRVLRCCVSTSPGKAEHSRPGSLVEMPLGGIDRACLACCEIAQDCCSLTPCWHLLQSSRTIINIRSRHRVNIAIPPQSNPYPNVDTKKSLPVLDLSRRPWKACTALNMSQLAPAALSSPNVNAAGLINLAKTEPQLARLCRTAASWPARGRVP